MQLKKYFAPTFATLLLAGASVANAAAPINVTWNPSGTVPPISTQGPFTFNNIVLNTYSNIDIVGSTFSEQGFLDLSLFNLGSAPQAIPNAGFPAGTPYSLYIQFTATGTQSPGIPSNGNFTSLSYTLFGAPGVTTYNANGAGIFSSSGAAGTALATGSLLSPGSTSISIDPVTGSLLPAAQVFASFIPNSSLATRNFFVNPTAFQNLDFSGAFTNTGSVITQSSIQGGTRLSINGGGGNATFALAAIPEPDTYGMLLAGLGLFGFVARRRSNRDAA
ncbi:MAG: flocculation-associated PEP-CTERM protein PepA [Burkholderiales bacterium]